MIYWINVIGAACSMIAMLLEFRKGRRMLAATFGCLAAYAIFNKIFPAILPSWLVFALPVAACALLIAEHTARQKRPSS